MNRIFTPFKAKEITPKGWLYDQLKVEANGLVGNLDKIWRDIRDSKWIGGDCDGWERVPYWLDGFIPLAYLLRDEDMIARAKKYIDAILSRQSEDGWICPCEKSGRATYDMWALFLILKVLIVYYDCSGDERIEDAVYNALKNFEIHNRHNTIFNWASARWYECVISIAWLYERRPEKWLLDLAKLLENQGVNYFSFRDYLKTKAEAWSYYKHIVNLSMAIKADSVMSLIDNRNPEKRAEKLVTTLQRYHGNINGYFNGDECLSGTSPSQGTELCGVAEAMYSYETIATTTLSTVWMDRCERLAFNAFPATVSEDMWSHQYDQLSNQPYCVDYKTRPHFATNPSDSHIFGLEPNYGCCTANMAQALPKFALSCFMRAKEGVAITSLSPCSLKTTVSGASVSITNETLYPFRDSVKIKVKSNQPVTFKLYIRIPAFYDKATVNGESAKVGEYYEIEKTWSNDEVIIELSATPSFVKRGTLYAVQRGALTYALPVKERWEKLEYEKNGVERKFPYCDYYVYPESEWQYGFCSTTLEYIEHDYEGQNAFSSIKPICAVKATVAPIKWGFHKKAKFIASPTPHSKKATSKAIEIELVPYGSAKLRMTELPFVKE